MYHQFKVCRCPNCGFIQLSHANKTFKCMRCKKTRAFSSRLSVPVLKSFPTGKEANVWITEYKRITAMKEEYH